jgi:hypothetical protein
LLSFDFQGIAETNSGINRKELKQSLAGSAIPFIKVQISNEIIIKNYIHDLRILISNWIFMGRRRISHLLEYTM